MENIVKTTVFVKDMNDFAKVNKLYGMMIPAPFPARSCVEVAALPAGAVLAAPPVHLLKSRQWHCSTAEQTD
jgi:2-iminobutanoate/2-iminopropanoate deaminase